MQCHKPYNDKTNVLLTSNNQYSIAATVACVLAHTYDAGL